MRSVLEEQRNQAALRFKEVYLDTGKLYVHWGSDEGKHDNPMAHDVWFHGDHDWTLEEVVTQIMYDFPDWSERLIRGLLHQYYNGYIKGTTPIAAQRVKESEEAQG